jgi:alpha-tubulin suppressor-like RCC1 family protein
MLSNVLRWGTVLSAALLASCSATTPTQLVVEIDGDFEKGTIERTEIHIGWLGLPGGETLSCGGDLPFSFGVAPYPGRPDEPATIDVSAMRPDGTLLVRAAAYAGFAQDRALLLRIQLTNDCRHIVCPDSATSCELGHCRPLLRTGLPEVDPSRLGGPTHQCSKTFPPFDAGPDGSRADAFDSGSIPLDSSNPFDAAHVPEDGNVKPDGMKPDGNESDASVADAVTDASTDAIAVTDASADKTDIGRGFITVGPGETFACGSSSTCAIVQGFVYCWGALNRRMRVMPNSDGGLPVKEVALRAELVPLGGPARSVCAGDGYACAAVEDDVFCWGENALGQLGTATTSAPRRRPSERVRLPAPAKSLGCSEDVACAILQDDTLWCWGSSAEGMLLQADTPGPVQLTSHHWFAAAPGQGHFCAIRKPAEQNDASANDGSSSGELWCWGRNGRGNLGLGTTIPESFIEPQRVGSSGDWWALSSDQDGSCGVRGDGQLYCWGADLENRTGLNYPAQFPPVFVLQPERVTEPSTWKDVATSFLHSCGVLGDGALECWGSNGDGQLGLETNARFPLPTRVVPPGIGAPSKFTRVRTGRFHTCARSEDGLLWCAGKNEDGQLGTGDLLGRRVFVRVPWL